MIIDIRTCFKGFKFIILLFAQLSLQIISVFATYDGNQYGLKWVFKYINGEELL